MTSRKRRGRGEGSIYQRKDGRWAADFSAGYYPDGRRRRKTIYGDTKQDVANKLRAAQGRGEAVFEGTSTMLLSDYLDEWLGGVELARRQATHSRYELCVRLQINPHIGGVRLKDLAQKHVVLLLATLKNSKNKRKKPVSDRMLQMTHDVLNRALRAALKQRLIERNPCDNVPRPQGKDETVRTWTQEQTQRFLAASRSHRLHALFFTALTTGMRQGELFALQWPQVDLDAGTIQVTHGNTEVTGEPERVELKTKRSRRRIDLDATTVAVLDAHRKRVAKEQGKIVPWVFCDVDGGPLRRSNLIRQEMRPLMKLAQVPQLRFHDMRHTAATLMLLQGVHPKVVQERLGHANIATTMDTYSHVLPGMQREAAERMDALWKKLGV